MDITEVSIVHHIAIVLLILWILESIGWSLSVLYFAALFYLFAVNQQYTVRLKRKLQYDERKYADQKRLLSDSESVRWLNHAVEKVWPICMEQVASQQFLLPIIPWFLDKYKPWTASKAVVEHLYLGRNPPMFTDIRVLELGMSFLSAKDMNAILSVQLRKTLGLGIWTNIHLAGMHLEGKVLVGVKFLRQWPFIGRVRMCFAGAPYFQLTVKPIFNHGIDVTEIPGIAGWLDNLLAVAFEQTLVKPNMLVIDVEKFASTPSESWFSIHETPPIAYVKLEIIEATDMKPSDLNGLADPYVKVNLGATKLQTNIQRKTLSPKWFEEFKIPISSWDRPNTLFLEVIDKDHIFDDMLGVCSVNISELRGGQRHDKWFNLGNIKMGKLHLAITVCEDEMELSTPKPNTNVENKSESFEEHHSAIEEFEPINIEGQDKTGVWIHRPGKEVCQTWEHRNGRSQRVTETELLPDGNEVADSTSSEASGTQGTDENIDVKRFRRHGTIGRGLQKLGSLFQRYPKQQNSSEEEEVIPAPRSNIRELYSEGTTLKFIIDDNLIVETGDHNNSPGKIVMESQENKATMKSKSEETVAASEKDSTRSKPNQTLLGESSLNDFLLSDEGSSINVSPSKMNSKF
ncbi:hypothetical protein KFK09_026441 [Dendrobium nobile]|uniref:C2 domain-containing protein n=1 Tax=Dendrobium nobile TaxID=94219 RepID=A0A8T3ACW5_DENNO|nr:hypothetical protein KFK09_026441 [Dendrobium nobile]